ncbi:hypothetical protein FKM82_020559 [Ascaphus truei]
MGKRQTLGRNEPLSGTVHGTGKSHRIYQNQILTLWHSFMQAHVKVESAPTRDGLMVKHFLRKNVLHPR